jgi:hypothetical protein
MSESGGPWPTDPWSGGAQQQGQPPPGQWPYPGMPGTSPGDYAPPPYGGAPGNPPPYGSYPPPPPPPYGYGYGPGPESGPYGQPYGMQNPYGAMPYGYGYPTTRPTNGMAIAALVCGICGFLCYVPGIVGIILGIIALNDINRTGRRGKGMAIAGIVCGGAWIALGVISLLTHAFSPV